MAQDLQKKPTNIGDQVLARVEALSKMGFSTPPDYNVVNAVKASYLRLQELKDKNGRPALEVCTPASIQSALFKMITRGLDASKNQCWLLVRGNVLCCDDSYFGKILMVKRIYPDWKPYPVIIREGDVFKYGIDPTTGKKFIITHETKLENMDNDFTGGYLYLPDGNLYVMTKKQILTAWSKSANKNNEVQKAFNEKMAQRTLVSTGCNIIINSTPSLNEYTETEETSDYEAPEEQEFVESEEIVETTEVIEAPVVEPKVETPAPKDDLPFSDNDEF